MAETKNTAKHDKAYWEEEIPYIEPLIDEDDPYEYVSVNGDNVQFERGEEVMLKRKFVEVLRNRNAALSAARKTRSGLKG